MKTIEPYKESDFNDIPKKNRGKWLSKFKLKFGCFKCGYNKCADALHFHHIDGNNKTKNVSMLKNAPSWKVIKEICSCSILCANCHIELHKEME